MKWARMISRVLSALLFLVLKLLFIIVLCLFGRPSLALYVWGKGRLCSFIAKLYDADPGMYRRERWKNTRKIVYARNKQMNRAGSRTFVCEASGYQSDDLGEFHVDHILSRSQFPMLAYRLDNLRLIRDKINVRKSDKLSVWAFIKFCFSKETIFALAVVALVIWLIIVLI